ncbi:twin-arginine translocation signal domain-containing protein [Rhodobacterales bacterium HKCCSP123]|nr:twin-arginine translocation signal domain-containing protein [Rhodobacterales bacterium HKCCSP123]
MASSATKGFIIHVAIIAPVSVEETDMITRRSFLQTAAVGAVATPMSSEATTTKETATGEGLQRPLRAEPRRRIIHARRGPSGGLRLYSDGSPDSRPLVRQEVLERAFGRGVSQSLEQPDHWRMIDEGWFEGDDLYDLTDLGSWDYAVWQANYHPECEAHDLLYQFFGTELMPGGGVNEEVGLAFSEHPCTPRLATVTLLDPDRLPDLATRVADLTEWVDIHNDRGLM